MKEAECNCDDCKRLRDAKGTIGAFLRQLTQDDLEVLRDKLEEGTFAWGSDGVAMLWREGK